MALHRVFWGLSGALHLVFWGLSGALHLVFWGLSGTLHLFSEGYHGIYIFILRVSRGFTPLFWGLSWALYLYSEGWQGLYTFILRVSRGFTSCILRVLSLCRAFWGGLRDFLPCILRGRMGSIPRILRRSQGLSNQIPSLWLVDIVDSGIGLSCRPALLILYIGWRASTKILCLSRLYPPSQGLRIWLQN